MAEYRVKWEIDIEATSPEAAAEQALDIQRDGFSMATCFAVIDEVGKSTPVDLGDAFNWKHTELVRRRNLASLLKAALHMLDNGEEISDGTGRGFNIELDPELAAPHLRKISEALDGLNIHDCDAVDKLFPH